MIRSLLVGIGLVVSVLSSCALTGPSRPAVQNLDQAAYTKLTALGLARPFVKITTPPEEAHRLLDGIFKPGAAPTGKVYVVERPVLPAFELGVSDYDAKARTLLLDIRGFEDHRRPIDRVRTQWSTPHALSFELWRDTDRERYLASNAFGALAEVSKEGGKSYHATWDPNAPTVFARNAGMAMVGMPETRRLRFYLANVSPGAVADLSVSLKARLLFEFVGKSDSHWYYYSAPRLDYPYETKLTRYGVQARLRGAIFTADPTDDVVAAMWISYPGDTGSIEDQVSRLMVPPN